MTITTTTPTSFGNYHINCVSDISVEYFDYIVNW